MPFINPLFNSSSYTKVIFLDFDGPLSNWRTVLSGGGTIGMDGVALGMLNSVCAASGAKIVCSSSRSWLHSKVLYDEATRIFEQLGLDCRHLHPEWSCNSGEPHDDKVRYIKDFLRRHPEITHHAVVDDDPLKGLGGYVRVSEHDGIRKRDIMKIARCLDFDIGEAFKYARDQHSSRQLRLPLDSFDDNYNQSVLRYEP